MRSSPYIEVEKDGENTFSVTFSDDWWGYIKRMDCTLDDYLEEHAGDLTKHLRLLPEHSSMSVILTDTNFDKRQTSFEVKRTEYVEPYCDDEDVVRLREHSHPVAGQDPRDRQSPLLPATPPLVIMTKERPMSPVERLVQELKSYSFTAKQLRRVGKQKSEPCLKKSHRDESCPSEPSNSHVGSPQGFFPIGKPPASTVSVSMRKVLEEDASDKARPSSCRASKAYADTIDASVCSPVITANDAGSTAANLEVAAIQKDASNAPFRPINSSKQSFIHPDGRGSAPEAMKAPSLLSKALAADASNKARSSSCPVPGRLSPYHSPPDQPNLWRVKLYNRRYGFTKPEPKPKHDESPNPQLARASTLSV